MKSFLTSNAKEKVLTAWQSLKMLPNESIHKYFRRFWDLHLKASFFKHIFFSKKKQQFCAGLLEEMEDYMNSQRPRSILLVIHHSIVAYLIYFQGGKKPSKRKQVDESKQKGTKSPNASKTQDVKKEKPKGMGFRGRSKLSLEEMEQYLKEGKCFKCGDHGHLSCVYPKQTHKVETQEDTRLKQYSYMQLC